MNYSPCDLHISKWEINLKKLYNCTDGLKGQNTPCVKKKWIKSSLSEDYFIFGMEINYF